MNLELMRIWQQYRKTVILITHSIPEAVLLSDRVVVMSPIPGRILEIIDIDIPRPRSLDVTGSAALRRAGGPGAELLLGRDVPHSGSGPGRERRNRGQCAARAF